VLSLTGGKFSIRRNARRSFPLFHVEGQRSAGDFAADISSHRSVWRPVLAGFGRGHFDKRLGGHFELGRQQHFHVVQCFARRRQSSLRRPNQRAVQPHSRQHEFTRRILFQRLSGHQFDQPGGADGHRYDLGWDRREWRV